jgi:hypothetical protein
MPCVEVALELSSWWSRVGGPGVVLEKQPFGKEPGKQDNLNPSTPSDYGGFVITDGSTYAPQMPWYMTHSCQAGFTNPNVDMQDPVCYADYFSPMNNGFSNLFADVGFTIGRGTVPWVGLAIQQPATESLRAGIDTCTMVMATFDLKPLDPDPAKFQYKLYNDNLFTWFNNSLRNSRTRPASSSTNAASRGTERPKTWKDFVYPQAKLNPFLGTFVAVKTANAVTGDDCNNVSPTGPPSVAQMHPDGPVPCRDLPLSQAVRPGRSAGGDVESFASAASITSCIPTAFSRNCRSPIGRTSPTPACAAISTAGRRSCSPGSPGCSCRCRSRRSADSGLTIYEQVYNSSIFSLFLPIANVADSKGGFPGRPYNDTAFYHTLLMSNHMEAEPELFRAGHPRKGALAQRDTEPEKMYQGYSFGNPRHPNGRP